MINEVKHLGRMLNARDGFDLGIFQVRIPARCLLSTHNSHRSCNLTVESQTRTPWTFPDAEVAWHAPALGYQLHLMGNRTLPNQWHRRNSDRTPLRWSILDLKVL
jgi:hypothetical protein